MQTENNNDVMAQDGITQVSEDMMLSNEAFSEVITGLTVEAIEIAKTSIDKMEAATDKEKMKRVVVSQLSLNCEKMIGINKADPSLGAASLDHFRALMESKFNCAMMVEDDRVYHLSVGVSNSRLKNVETSGLNYFYNSYENYMSGIQRKTSSMGRGTFMHSCVLEPETMGKYVSDKLLIDEVMRQKPDSKSPRATTIYKTLKKNEEAKGRTIVNDALYSETEIVLKRIGNHPKVSKMLSEGVAEACIYAICNKTGLIRRIKPDWMTKDGFIADYKTTVSITKSDLERTIAKFNYIYQAVDYINVASLVLPVKPCWIWFFQESAAPYEVSAKSPVEAAMEYAEEKVSGLVSDLANMYESNSFPPVSQEIESIDIPAWLYNN